MVERAMTGILNGKKRSLVALLPSPPYDAGHADGG